MKISEIITEVTQGKLTKRQQNATRGLHTFVDPQGINSDYTFYRVGMAAAMADGKSVPEIDALSWIGKKKATAPYSECEVEMLKHAYAAAGADWDDLNHGDLNSGEIPSVNKSSPVAKRQKNKYGV